MARLPRHLAKALSDLKRFCRSNPPLYSLTQVISREVASALSADAIAFLKTDPVTFLVVDAQVAGFSDPDARHFFGHIYLQRELVSFLDLKRRGDSSSLLSEYTNGQPELEPRYREVYRPNGLEHEVRSCIRTADAHWGAFCIARGDDQKDFSPLERLFLTLLAPYVGEAMRAEAARSDSRGAPGSVVTLLLDKNDRVIFRSKGTEAVLTYLGYGVNPDAPLPAPLQSVVNAHRSIEASDTPPETELQITIRDREGGWWTITALGPDAEQGSEVARVLIIAPALPRERFPRLVAAHDLTPREREVVSLIALGLSTEEIGQHLYLSSYTVQDYLKGVFAKVGVTSRRQLMARLFHEESAVGQLFKPDHY